MTYDEKLEEMTPWQLGVEADRIIKEAAEKEEQECKERKLSKSRKKYLNKKKKRRK